MPSIRSSMIASPSGSSRPPRSADRTVEHAKIRQGASQRVSILEANPDHPEPLRRPDICLRVIDEDRHCRVESVALEEVAVDAFVGFRDPDLAGDDDALEPLAKRVAQASNGKRLRRPVADGKEPHAA